MPEIIPSKDLSKEEQIKALRSTPEWQMYKDEVEKMIGSITTKLDTCKAEELGGLQGEKRGLRMALNLIYEIK